MKADAVDEKDIRFMRKITGLSQERFGRQFHISASNVQKWERGLTHPPSYVAHMMARILLMEAERGELKPSYTPEVLSRLAAIRDAY